jgi:GNAT superfamily N-acetyltransferase
MSLRVDGAYAEWSNAPHNTIVDLGKGQTLAIATDGRRAFPIFASIPFELLPETAWAKAVAVAAPIMERRTAKIVLEVTDNLKPFLDIGFQLEPVDVYCAPKYNTPSDGETDSPYQFTRYEAEDFTDLMELLIACGSDEYPNDPGVDIPSIARYDRNLVLLAKHEGKVVGCAAYSNDGRRGWISYVAVAEEYRGSGIATCLLLQLDAFGISSRDQERRLVIRASTPSLRQFYVRHGYFASARRVLTYAPR